VDDNAAMSPFLRGLDISAYKKKDPLLALLGPVPLDGVLWARVQSKASLFALFQTPQNGSPLLSKSHVSAGGGMVGGASVGASPPVPVYNIRFAEPVLASFTKPLPAVCNMCARIVAGSEPGFSARKRAKTPDTCGQAMEVPLMVADPTSAAFVAEVIDTPGAKMFTHDP